MKSSWVPTLGIFFYANYCANIDKHILVNFVQNFVHDTVTNSVYMPMCSRSVIRINTLEKDVASILFPMCKLTMAII